MRPFLKQILLYSTLFWLLNMGIGHFLHTYETVDLHNKGQFYPILRWEDYYQRSENIDMLVLGSSHAYRAFDPKMIGSEIKENNRVFNFGSAAQSPVSSYYILKEVLQKHQPKLVVFDIYFVVFAGNNQLRSGRFNWQQMQEGVAKRDFYSRGFSLAEKVYLFLFPSLVYKDYVNNKFNKSLGRQYMPLDKGTYQGDGFVSKADTLSLEKLKNGNQFDFFKIEMDAITKQNLAYLEKIKNLCAAENISLVFTSSPMPAISVEKIENYLAFHQLFEKKASEWGIPFFDYNIKRIVDLSDTAHYYDDDHLNAAGAAFFSKAFVKDLKAISR